MGFDGCDEAFGPGIFLRLEADGDSVVAAFIGEPVSKQGTFKGKPRTQAAFPLWTEAGLMVWTRGVKQYKALRDAWDRINGKLFTITRSGETGSTETTYDLKPVRMSPKICKLIAAITAKEISDILKQATQAGTDGDGDDAVPF